MKRVLWHLPFGMIGGVETLYATILKYIDKTSFDHFVTCHENIKIWVGGKYNRYASCFVFSDAKTLAARISTIKPDIIIGTHGRALYEAMELLQEDIPIIECVHGSHIWSEHNVYMPKTWTKHLICVSKSAERVYLQSSSNNISTSVIINGVDTEIFHPSKPFSQQSKVIAYSGRFLESDKHLKKIIDAFKGLGDMSARLYLIGGHRAEIMHLEHYCKMLKMAARVKFYEHTDHPEKYFKTIDLFTVRSEAEGYCNSVAEALACGVPSVCYNFGGILEHVPEGTIAVGKNQAEYALKLREVHNNPTLRKRMSEMGLSFIQKDGNATTMAQKYAETIHAVLAGKTITNPKEVKKEAPSNVAGVSVSLRTSRPIVGVCNPSWHGIASATKNICDEIVHWNNDPAIMARNVARHNPRGVLFSGMCPGFDRAAVKLHKENPEFPLYFYYHGGASHYSFKTGLFGQGESEAFQKALDLHSAGVFKKIAVSSPGFDAVLRTSGIKAQFCGNLMTPFNLGAVPKLDGFHIGNWNRNWDHKHTSIGVAAGLLIKGSTIHCLSAVPVIPGLDYGRVKKYTEMPQASLYQKYAQMDVNLQMSFIETFNISVLEMWASGGPVLVGPGNYVLVQGSKLLSELCMVVDQTNPVAVANHMEAISNRRDEVVQEQYRMLQVKHDQVRKNWQEFFL